MSVNHPIPMLMLALACVGCGPSASTPENPPEVESWLLGAFSRQKPPLFTMDHTIQRITFNADHTAFSQTIVLSDQSSNERLRIWEARSDEEVAVPMNPDETASKEYLVSPGEDCNTIELRIVSNTDIISDPAPWSRGEVCVREEAPDGHSSYELYWCDEPPPECDEP